MILDTIAASTRARVEAQKKSIPPEEMKRLAAEAATNGACPHGAHSGGTKAGGILPGGTQTNGIHSNRTRSFGTHSCETAPDIAFPAQVFPFETALRKPGVSFICEVKKASPSKGLIAPDFPYVEIAREYEWAGADVISVLTEPEFFLGSGTYLSDIRKCVGVPLLRKDFILDEYQLYETKLLGAAAVLLICALLNTETLRDYIGICDSLGLSALVEAHDEAEVTSALDAGVRIIGVNNRNLKTFEVDLMNCIRLRPLVPDDILFVAESGIKSAEDIATLRSAGVDAVLIGETLMRSPDKTAALAALKGSS